ncbi:hypothetical protein HYY74_04200 [Candidatus Woesearchaeota archaeon]|nr:hypothetical protein [Candidatus Woesearchaeota archaeon]
MGIDQKILDCLYSELNPQDVEQVLRAAEGARLRGSKLKSAGLEEYLIAASEDDPVLRQQFLDRHNELNPKEAVGEVLYWPFPAGHRSQLMGGTRAMTFALMDMMGLGYPVVILFTPRVFSWSYLGFLNTFVHELKHATDFYHGLHIPTSSGTASRSRGIIIDHTNFKRIDPRILGHVEELSAYQASYQYAKASGQPKELVNLEREHVLHMYTDLATCLRLDSGVRTNIGELLYLGNGFQRRVIKGALEAARDTLGYTNPGQKSLNSCLSEVTVRGGKHERQL